MKYLVERLAQSDERIIIPTPVLSEIVVRLSVGKVNDLLATLNASAWFRVESFDSVAAIELGMRTAKAIAEGDKREGLQADWTKVKFDRQIVSIAMVNGATAIISDDPDIVAICDRWGFRALSVEDLEIPPELVVPPLFRHLEADA